MEKQLFRLACLAVLVLAGISSNSTQAMCCFGGKKQNKVSPVTQAEVNSFITQLLAKSEKHNGLIPGDCRKLQNWINQLKSEQDRRKLAQGVYSGFVIRPQFASPEEKSSQKSKVFRSKKSTQYVVESTAKRRHLFAQPKLGSVLDEQVAGLCHVAEYHSAITQADISFRLSQ